MPPSAEPPSAESPYAEFDGDLSDDRAALFAEWDSLTPDDLAARGSLKWTMHPGAVGAWVAESDLGTAPAVASALHKAVDGGHFGYLPPAIGREMARETATLLRERFGWSVPSSRVHPVADVIHALEATIRHYTRANSAVIVPTPAYMPFLTVPPALDRAVVEVPLASHSGRQTLDLVAIEDALRDGAGLVLLCNPLNPGGRVFDRAELEALAEVVSRHDATVFADEIHAPIVFGSAVHVPYASVSEAAARHTITALSASKAWNLPGLKTAQLVTSSDAAEDTWQALGPLASHGASTLGVIANTVAYRDGLDWLDHTVAYYDRNRRVLGERLEQLLPGVGYRAPEGTYIAWLDVRELGLGDDPATRLRDRAGIALTDGRACGAVGAGHVRLILATPTPIVELIVERVAAEAR
jgi:cysteine-S-conjugate beta-lyase